MTVYEVLVEPNRRRILDLLRRKDACVGEIVGELGMSQPAVSKHLKVMRDAGVVSSRVDAQRRVYRVEPAPLSEVDKWLAPYRRFWTRKLDTLEEQMGKEDQP